MSKSADKAQHQTPVEYVPCVLKLDNRKFVCYVEEYIGSVPPLNPLANAVKIFSKRKKAWRAAVTMALARSGAIKSSKNAGKYSRYM